MKNSYDSYVLGLYEAILADCQVRYPHLQKDLGRDSSRLLSCVKIRGLSFLMIDLVDFGKHFDICLSKQRLTPSHMAFQRPYAKGTPIPRLFKGLMLRVFDASGTLRPDCDETAVACLRQLYYTAKKFRLDSSDKRKEKVLNSFFATDSELRQGSINWDLDDPDWTYLDSVHLDQIYLTQSSSDSLLFEEDNQKIAPELAAAICNVQSVADIITSTLGVFHPELWKMKHGPGAVSDAKAGSDKYLFPHWCQKLERVFPIADFGYANFNVWATHADRDINHVFRHEPPSKLILVPKVLKAPRLIASEPTSHQWCQQSIKDYITTRVHNSFIKDFISFRDQIPNQEMAWRGSLDQTLATIDLSEASDRVSCYLVERLFRKETSLIDALQACRTRWVKNPTGYGTFEFLKLKKFSTMGSACTFPIQSLVFLSIAIGTVLSARHQKATFRSISSLIGEVRVFGDDIIVPTDCVDRVTDVLTLCGLAVNRLKTFGDGNFRESCGYDAFKGHEVTPVYVMSVPSRPKPESIVGVVATHNNFLARGWYKCADYLAATVRAVSSQIRNVELGSGDFGLQVIGYVDNTHLPVRWNPHLQRRELRTTLLQSKSPRSRTEADSMLLQYFTENPSPLSPWSGGVASRPVLSLKNRWVGL
jgi:hypothetical protein